MRLLYVTNGFPFPLTSGYLRHYYLIRELSQRHSITLFSLVNDDFHTKHLEALAPFTDNIVLFRRATPGQSSFAKAIGSSRMLSGLSPAVRQLWRAIGEVTSAKLFDVSFFSGKFTLPVNQCLGGVPAVADICDAGSVRLRGRMQIARLVQLPMLIVKYLCMRRLENRVRSRAAHSIFASCRDRDALTVSSDPNATVVPNGVDLEYWQRVSQNHGAGIITFTGAMNYGPNIDAATHLITDIFPQVREAIPGAQLLIVGRDPVRSLLEHSKKQAGVTVTGFVDDMRPHLEAATLFVAPLRFAAGVQNKVLEAMAMEMNIVASPAAAGGIYTEDGQAPPLDIADGPTAFANSIIRQLRSEKSTDINPQSRIYVQKHFGWRQGADKLERALYQVTRGQSLVNTASYDLSYIKTATR